MSDLESMRQSLKPSPSLEGIRESRLAWIMWCECLESKIVDVGYKNMQSDREEGMVDRRAGISDFDIFSSLLPNTRALYHGKHSVS